MRTVHDALIELSQFCGYASSEGYCSGFTLKWLEACFLGKHAQQQLYQRINIIHQEEAAVVVAKWQAVRAKIIELAAIERQSLQQTALLDSQLTEDERLYLEIPAFLDALNLAHNPFCYRSIFLKQVPQRSVDVIWPLVESRALSSLGGLTVIGEAIDCYRDAVGHQQSLQLLQQIADEAQQSIGCILNSLHHSVGLYYEVESSCWHVLDLNQWPVKIFRDLRMMMDYLRVAFAMDFSTSLVLEIRVLGRTSLKDSIQSPLQMWGLECSKSTCFSVRNANEADEVLYWAIQQRDNALIDVIFRHSCRPELSPQLRFLSVAITRGFEEIARKLILEDQRDDRCTLVFHVDSDGDTPLTIAVGAGQDSVVRDLISVYKKYQKIGLLIQENHHQMSPLRLALRGNHRVIAEELLAALFQTHQLEEFTKQNERGESLCWQLANAGNTEVLSMILPYLRQDHRQRILTIRDSLGISPLWIAVYHGHTVVVRQLVQALIALPEAVNFFTQPAANGMGVLFIAIKQNHWDSLSLLLAGLKEINGIEQALSQVDRMGRTLDEWASFLGVKDAFHRVLRQVVGEPTPADVVDTQVVSASFSTNR